MNVRLLSLSEYPEETICRAARNDYMSEFVGDMSYDEVMKGVDGDMIFEKEEMLITHLLKHGHFGPLEHVSATFAIEGISRSCMAQLTRHRHASFDVQSMRYVSFDDRDATESVVRIPELDDPGLCGRNAEFADGMGDNEEEIKRRREHVYWSEMKNSMKAYDRLLELGVAPENARMVLPIGTKVNMVVSFNARMLLHIADMRAAADAQWEIRELTEELLDIAERVWVPTVVRCYRNELQGRKNRLSP